MQPADLLKRVDMLSELVAQLQPFLGLEAKQTEMARLEILMQGESFWADQQAAQRQSQSYTRLQEYATFWNGLEAKLAELRQLIEQNTDESDETMAYLEREVVSLEKAFHDQRIVALLSKRYDDHSAVVAIHAGAGGTDAQDWAEMLLRMYLRYCDERGFSVQMIETSRGGEAGIKSVLFEVHGANAYGYLKCEAGVHRLVRLSPFNPSHTRETSFALVEVLPLLDESEGVQLDPKDLKIEANTASGHGGQSVNTTYSAIRITHIPTGIRVSIQNERSQHQNKELALKILAARVQKVEEEKVEAEKKQLRGEFKSAEWGNQIRSYVLHPYKMVKDHRTGYETSDPESVLNGQLDELIERYLELRTSHEGNV